MSLGTELARAALILGFLYGMVGLAILLARALPRAKAWWEDPADDFGEVDVQDWTPPAS